MPILIPSIDLLGGEVVRLHQGDYAKVTTYPVDPVAYARALRGRVERLHVVDLEGSRSGAPTQLDAIARIVEAFGEGVQVGGGVRCLDDVTALAARGVSRFVLGTAAIRDAATFSTIARTYPDRVVLAVDARGGLVSIQGWTETSTLTPLDVATRFADLALDALLFTDVSRDGTRIGPAIDTTARLALESHRKVIASGGVGSLDHLRALRGNAEIYGVIVGRALFDGSFSAADALASLG